MSHMLQKSSMTMVVGVFFEEPTRNHYLVEISQKANLAHTVVKKHILQLKKWSLIEEYKEKRGKRIFPIYNANLNHKQYKIQKKIYNLTKLLNSGLIEYLKDNLMPNSIVLFGSYQKGEDIETSDLDLFVESKKEDLNLKKFEKFLNRKIQVHFKDKFTKFPPELKNNIINGIVLDGYLEVF